MTAASNNPHEEAKVCPFPAKAAAVVLVFAVALGLFLLIFFSLPGKSTSWRTALPTASMHAEEARIALMRAELLHEGTVRPQLIMAGFGTEGDLRDSTRYAFLHRQLPSRQLADCLWTLRAFPELHTELLALLLDSKLSAQTRSERFYAMTGALSALAESFANGATRYTQRYSTRFHAGDLRWFAFFNNVPSLQTYRAPTQQQSKEALQQERALYTQKLALAQKILPLILQDMMRDADQKAAADKLDSTETPERKKGQAGPATIWNDARAYGAPAAAALNAIWDKRNDPTFLPLALEALRSGKADPAARYASIAVMAQTSGLPAKNER